MRRFIGFLTLMTFAVSLLFSGDKASARYWEKMAEQQQKPKAQGPGAAGPKKDDLKPFGDLIKGFDKVPGLFDFYVNKKDGSVFMAVKPDQLNKIYLCSETRSAGDGSFFDSGAQTDAFPFMLKQIGRRLQFVQINLKVRADSTAALDRAMGRSISNSIFGSTNIASSPDNDGSFLIDPSSILVTDVGNISYFLGSEGKTGFRFDKENSNFGTIKSFPQNTEIDVVLHYKTDKPANAPALTSPYSMLLTYHYSFSTLPETNYRPRLADDRVGFFTTIYQDYTKINNEETYVRYINRWNLEKKDPTAAVSEPKQPIVYWIENTTPEEYRDDVRKGIEFWNKAFEKAGFKNAIIAKQMPDTADWDPADVRFNTVRWFVSPGAGYAVGPSRANPFTGEIYDADVRISADFVRYMFSYADNYLDPLSMGTSHPLPHNPGDENSTHHWGEICDYGEQSSRLAAEGMALLYARTPFEDLTDNSKKYIHEYIQELVSHEVGHTLGLRHNFKASTAHSRSEQLDPSFTAANGIVGTVMEYAPPNIAPEGKPQPDFYTVTPGPYDYWAIEYGYKPIDAASTESEKPELEKIASRSSDPTLAYGTDEDCFGNSSRAVDPYATQFDLGSDPLEYWKMRVDLSKELWSKVETKFEKPGANYKKLRNVFSFGWSAYSAGGNNVSRFIGGLENHRDHVGEPNGNLPFEPISAAKQRAAMKFLTDYVWAPDAFNFSADLLNKLQPERSEDFNGSMFAMSRLDYPLHNQVLAVQSAPLNHIYNPLTLGRLSDIDMHYPKGQDVYTMSDVFQDVRKAIWSELASGQNVNGFRRNLQREHLSHLIDLITDETAPVPEDARTLARVDLRTLKGALSGAVNSASLNTITKGHYEDALSRINAALSANVNVKL